LIKWEKQMRKIFLIVAMAVASLTCAAQDPITVDLILLTAVDEPAQMNNVIKLRDAKNQRCEYLGELERGAGIQPSLLAKAAGEVGTWSIAVTRKACDGRIEPVSLVVPLMNIERTGYSAGTHVQAVPRAK
jgi:hypothetical protein